MSIDHPQSQAEVSPSIAQARHLTEWATLSGKVGSMPSNVFYKATLHPIPESKLNFLGVDFDNEPDFRAPLSKVYTPFVKSLDLCTKHNSKTIKVSVPLPSLASSFPLELFGEDPSVYGQNPSVWLLNQNGDDRYWGYTEWKVLGMYRKVAGKSGPRKTPSPFIVQLYRQGQSCLLVEGKSNLFTLKELMNNLNSSNQTVAKEANKILSSVPYLFGHTYWTNRQTIPQKDHSFWEAYDASTPQVLAMLAIHTTNIQNKVFPVTQDFSFNSNAGFYPLTSCRNATRDKLFEFERNLGKDKLHSSGNLNKLVNAVFEGKDFDTEAQALATSVSCSYP